MLNAFTENSRLDDDEDDGDGDGDSDGDGDGDGDDDDDDSFDAFRAHDELGTCMTSLGCFTFVDTVLNHVLNRRECAEL